LATPAAAACGRNQSVRVGGCLQFLRAVAVASAAGLANPDAAASRGPKCWKLRYLVSAGQKNRSSVSRKRASNTTYHGGVEPHRHSAPIIRLRHARAASSPRLRVDRSGPAILHFWLLRDDIMSVMQMFLPASEPARSEALAQFLKTHHIPRRLVRGLGHKDLGEQTGPAALVGPMQRQQQASQDAKTQAAPES